jgi:hypothetical protein
MKEVNYPDLPTPKEFLEGKNLLGTLGKTEAEEMFGELLKLSYEADKWVAPSLEEFGRILDEKVVTMRKNAEAAQRNAIKRAAYEKKRKWAWFLRLIGRKLTEPEYEEVIDIISVITLNSQAPMIGLRYMTDKGYLSIENGPGKTNYAVLTQKALDTLK